MDGGRFIQSGYLRGSGTVEVKVASCRVRGCLFSFYFTGTSRRHFAEVVGFSGKFSSFLINESLVTAVSIPHILKAYCCSASSVLCHAFSWPPSFSV